MTAPDQIIDVQRDGGDRVIVEAAHDFPIARAVAVLGDEGLDKAEQFLLFLGGADCLVFVHITIMPQTLAVIPALAGIQSMTGARRRSESSLAGDITSQTLAPILSFFLSLLWAAKVSKTPDQDTTRGDEKQLVAAPSERLRRFHLFLHMKKWNLAAGLTQPRAAFHLRLRLVVGFSFLG